MTSAFEQAREFFASGLAHYQAGRYELAEKQFEASLALVPQRASTLTNLGATRIKLGRFADALVVLEEANRADPADAQAWAHLATCHAELGRLDRALRATDEALRIAPGLAAAWTLRGSVLRDLGRADEAAQAFRAAIDHGGDAQLNGYFLAALGGASAPARAPRAYVQSLFDGYAEGFERHLVDVLHYDAPQRLVEGLGDRHFDSVLDLGCGSGLVGVQLQGRATRIVGVDLSQAMVAQAQRRGVYSEVVQADVGEFLAGSDARFDLVTAADVFIYVGDLGAVFAGVRRVLASGGVFAFTVELADEAERLALRPSLRYAHSRGYLQSLAAQSGFEIRATAQHAIREDQGRPVAGLFAWLSAG